MGNASSSSKKKDSGRKQKRTKKPVTIRGHDHQVKYHKQIKEGSTYLCNGCRQPGFGPHYMCIEGCNVHYHLPCCDLLGSDSSSAAPVGNHDPYPTGHLVFKESEPRKVRCCTACGNRVRGLRYKVEHKKAPGWCIPYSCCLCHHLNYRAFHPLCASLPLQLQELPAEIQELASQIQEPSKLRMVLELKEKIRGECLICKGDAKGWAYNSLCGKYCCHVGCMMKIIQSFHHDETSKKRKMTVETKKWLQEISEIVFQLIMGALVKLPPETAADISRKFCELIFVLLFPE